MVRKNASIPAVYPVDSEYAPHNSMRHVGGDVLNLGLVANQKQRNLQFDDCIPNGVVTQTANGTSRDVGTGNNRDEPYCFGENAPGGPWPAGRSNRTGE